MCICFIIPVLSFPFLLQFHFDLVKSILNIVFGKIGLPGDVLRYELVDVH